MKILQTIALLLFPIVLHATEQQADILLYKGQREIIFSTPLESLFAKGTQRPEWLKPTSTACLRGYVATWELSDNQLYLQKIVREEYDPANQSYRNVDITNRILPEETAPIKAIWVTDSLRIPKGAPIMRSHLGFETIYEKTLILRFEKGILMEENLLTNSMTTPPFLDGRPIPPPPKSPAQ
jgi:hypothetical protein